MRLVLEALLRPEREITTTIEGGIVQSVSYRGRVPLLIEERVYAPAQRARACAAPRSLAACSRAASASTRCISIGLVVALLACARLGLLG